ncbi:MAG: HNH endonuclease [Betaproteobacteria bacterium]|nr:HNH endonuclease [Betaproteobacteria bacterium]
MVSGPDRSFLDGYRQVRVNGKQYREHHLVWLLHNGRMPSGELDHINCVRDDNRIENLRECTREQNTQNRRFRCAATGLDSLALLATTTSSEPLSLVAARRHTFGLFQTAEEANAAYMPAQRAHGMGEPM